MQIPVDVINQFVIQLVLIGTHKTKKWTVYKSVRKETTTQDFHIHS